MNNYWFRTFNCDNIYIHTHDAYNNKDNGFGDFINHIN